jgi:hypothetical protein
MFSAVEALFSLANSIAPKVHRNPSIVVFAFQNGAKSHKRDRLLALGT